MSDNHLSELRFDSLALHESVQAGIRDAGFEFCTPIQASTLPIALEPATLPDRRKPAPARLRPS